MLPCLLNSTGYSKYLIALLFIFWIVSIFILLCGLFPRSKFVSVSSAVNEDIYQEYLENDYRKVMNILSSKIFYIRVSFILIGFWCLFLLILEIIYYLGI